MGTFWVKPAERLNSNALKVSLFFVKVCFLLFIKILITVTLVSSCLHFGPIQKPIMTCLLCVWVFDGTIVGLHKINETELS